VRVVAATNRTLLDLVSQGKFRDDLYFRLAVVKIAIPPLSERRGDIPFLVDHFIERFNAKRGKTITGVTPAVMEIFMRHEFPGNVRELENLIEHGFVLCHQGLIDVKHLPEDVQHMAGRTEQPEQRANVSAVKPGTHLEQAEAEAILDALRESDGHLGETADALGVSRTTLWRKMKKHGIQSKTSNTPS